MALIMCRGYRNSLVDGNVYPVEITGGRSFGEGQVFSPLRAPWRLSARLPGPVFLPDHS